MRRAAYDPLRIPTCQGGERLHAKWIPISQSTRRGAVRRARISPLTVRPPTAQSSRKVYLGASLVASLPPALNAGLEWSFACPGLGSGDTSLLGALGAGIGGGGAVAGGASCAGCVAGAAVGAGGGVSVLLQPAARTSALEIARTEMNRFIAFLHMVSRKRLQSNAPTVPERGDEPSCQCRTRDAGQRAFRQRDEIRATNLPGAPVQARGRERWMRSHLPALAQRTHTPTVVASTGASVDVGNGP